VETVFCYGTLEWPQVVETVTGRRFPGAPAVLPGFARFRMRQQVYPAVVECEGAETRGLVWLGVDAHALARLDAFEGALYERRALEVRGEAGETFAAWAYVLHPRERARLSDEPWDRDTFAQRHLATFLAGVRGVP
jgi:gamma-glutamylcyclotransferase (GGCT)/AIG2-like uncharacterized protein YtfP